MMDHVEHKKGENQRGEEELGERTKNKQKKTADYDILMEGISCRMEEKRAEIDWEEEVHDLMQEGKEDEEEIMKEKESENEYYGHDMNIREKSTGCRLITVNANNTCPNIRNGKRVITDLIDKMIAMKADIMLVNEPGQISEKEAAAIRKEARAGERECEAVIRNKGAGTSEGIIAVLNPAWRMLKTYDRLWEGKGHSPARVLQMNFESAAKGEKERRANARRDGEAYIKEKMTVFAVYGYSGESETKKSRALWETVNERLRKVKEDPRHRFDTIIVAGDFNMCADTQLDTDKPNAKPGQKEPEAGLLEGILEELKVVDAFRAIHKETTAVTRIPQGKKALTDAARRLDYICTNKEIAYHPSTRIGICKEPLVKTDHLPVVIDIPTNCAGLAEDVQKVWDHHEVKKLRPEDIKTVSEEGLKEFSNTFCRGYREVKTKDLEKNGKLLLEQLYKAAKGTVAEEVTLKYPKRARTTIHREGWGEKLDAWSKRINGACRQIKRLEKKRDLDQLSKALEKVKWRWKEIPEGLTVDKLEDLVQVWKGGKEEVKRRLVEQKEEIKKHLKKAEEKEKRERIKTAKQKRDEAFNSEADKGKGKGRMIASVFRAAKEYEELRWVKRDDEDGGGVASSHKEVGTVVNKFFEKWFKSRVSIEERWGSWDKMMNMDTSEMGKEEVELVQRCYLPEYEENKERSEKEGWWEGMREEITLEELKAAIKRSKSDKASGPSQVGINLIKMLDDAALEEIRTFYNECMKEGGIPDSINNAILRLLPKSDKGLGDMNAVRPIALMENIVKTFEQVIIGRVMKVITEREILDLAQYGGLPKAGTAPPVRVLAEIMDDARESGQELHILLADLTKAFDTMEYWTQAMSWRCLGMPEGIIELLVNMDSGKNQGEGATTQVALAQGRMSDPFRHQRGVRQGSVGGPLKWCVFIHFWLKWVKREMKGRGYKMSTARGIAPKVETWEKRMKAEEAEMIGQCFIDDSIWATSKAEDMQTMIRMHERFCNFHKVMMHKTKSEYITINGKGQQIRWNPKGKKKEEKEETREKIGGKEGFSQSQTKEKEVPQTPGEQRRGIRRYWATVENPTQSGRTEKPDIGEAMGEKGKDTMVGSKKVKAFKYLGVWYETEKGWSKQREVLLAKHREMLGKVSRANISLPQAVVAVNMKIIPTLLYPLQVAITSVDTLKSWDAQIRLAIQKKGKIHRGLAKEFYYLQPEDGGFGLRSIVDAVDEQRLRLDIQALNDENHNAGEGRGRSIQARIVSAAKQRYKEREGKEVGTLTSEIEKAKLRMRMEVRETTAKDTLERVRIKDAIEAEAHGVKNRKEGEGLTIYTDGSTIPGENSSSGWGVVVTDDTTEEETLGRVRRRWRGRLKGKQDNFTAESMALLQAMKGIRTSTDAQIMIDNHAVVKRWDIDNSTDPRARFRGPARAIWNRIACMKKEREYAGGRTEARWVHSHVDEDEEPGRKAIKNKEEEKGRGGTKERVRKGPSLFPYKSEKEGSTGEEGEEENTETRKDNKKQKETTGRKGPICVCGQSPCEGNHKHHKGNDEADKEAAEGRKLQAEEEDEVTVGEERYHVVYEGQVCQDDITRALQEATKQNRINRMGNSETKSERNMERAIKVSDKGFRKEVWGKGKLAMRYITRAMADKLPTYKHEERLRQEGNSYDVMYGDNIVGGTCKLCNTGAVETLEHVMCECEHGREIRKRTMDKVGNLWEGKDWEGGWPIYDYINTTVTDWRKHWGWLGLVPKEILKGKVSYRDQGKIKEAAKLLAKAGHDMWTHRVQGVREWEKEVGIEKAKSGIKNGSREKRNKQQTGKKRGRPRKEEEELSAAYAPIRERKDRIKELMEGGIIGKEEAGRMEKKEAGQIKKVKRDWATRKEMEILSTEHQEVKDRRKQFKVEVKCKPKAKKYNKTKSKVRAVTRRIGEAGEGNRTGDALEAYRVLQGGCEYRGCNQQGEDVPTWCKTGGMRCKRHTMLRCMGMAVMCSCETQEPGKEQEPVNIDKETWERVRRLKTGDNIKVRRNKGKMIIGTVEGWQWTGTGGYRVPDEILITWTNNEGKEEEGEVKVSGNWVKIETERKRDRETREISGSEEGNTGRGFCESQTQREEVPRQGKAGRGNEEEGERRDRRGKRKAEGHGEEVKEREARHAAPAKAPSTIACGREREISPDGEERAQERKEGEKEEGEIHMRLKKVYREERTGRRGGALRGGGGPKMCRVAVRVQNITK